MNKIQPNTEYLGKNIIYLPSCHSTNDFSAEIIQNGNFENGTIVYTDFQTKGRGQRGNTWESNEGENLMASIIIKPNFIHAVNQFDLNIAFSLALAEVFYPILNQNFKIKWPNDLYYLERKMGGVLIENSILGSTINTSIVGFGININQTIFENANATSLKVITGKTFNLSFLFEQILEKFEEKLNELEIKGCFALRDQYINNLLGYKEDRKFKINDTKFTGIIIGVNETGRLLIFTDGITESFDFKEISFLFEDNFL